MLRRSQLEILYEFDEIDCLHFALGIPWGNLLNFYAVVRQKLHRSTHQ